MDAKIKARMEKEGRSMKKGGDEGKDGKPAISSLAEMVEKQAGTHKTTLEEFRFLKVLGKGSFGKVSLNAGSTSTDGVSETYMLKRNTVNKILPFIKEQMCELATAITTATLLVSGDARGEEGYRGGVRD